MRIITFRPLDEEAGLLVSLGYYIGLWWQSKRRGGKVLVQLNRNNERIIEDLNNGEKTGVKTILYDLLKKYEGIKYRPEETFDFLNEIAHVYSQYPQLQSTNPITILYFSANPSAMNSRTDDHTNDSLSLNKEYSAIQEEIESSEFEKEINLIPKFELTADELSDQLLKYKPQIVHFSGHGNKDGQIILQYENGKKHPMNPVAVANLFSILKNPPRCVVLSACYSKNQAKLISKYVDCVIGMSEEIGDEAATKFAHGFYRSICRCEDLETPVRFGRVQIGLNDYTEDERIPEPEWKTEESRRIVLVNPRK